MPPPNKIQSSEYVEETGLVCSLPPKSVSSESVSPEPVSTETVIAVSNDVVYIQDDARQMSYARPVSSFPGPAHVLTFRPAETDQDRRAARALGRALESLVLEMDRSGESVAPEVRQLVNALKSGQLPSREEVTDSPFFNQSLVNTRLDALVHAVAVKVAGDDQLHQTALALSLQYYFSRNPSDPVDQSIRQGLVVALSTNAPSREILARAIQNSPESVRTEVANALSHSEGAKVTEEAVAAGAAAGAQGTVAVAPSQSSVRTAFNVATQVAAITSPGANALLHGAGLVLTALGIDRGPLPPYQETLIVPFSRSLVGPGGYLPPLVIPNLPLSGASREGAQPNPENTTGGSNSTFGVVPLNTSEPSPEAVHASKASGDVSSSTLADPSSAPSVPLDGIVTRAFSSLGLPTPVGNAILASLSSPLIVAAAALQGGYSAALLSGQSSVVPYASNVSYFPQYAVAAVTSATESHSDTDSSHSDSSGERHSGGQGSQQQDENPQHSSQQEPDIYLA